MNYFHNLLFGIITLITIFVLILLVYVLVRFRASANPVPSKTSHNTLIEVVWTVVPILILIVIAVPSFKLLYYADKAPDAKLTIKAIGRSEEHTSELQSLMRISYAVFCLKKKT